MKKLLALLAALWLCCAPCLSEETDGIDDIIEENAVSAREEFINRIIETGHSLFTAAKGRLQRAHYAGDIYICKNFTVHVFRENCGHFRMAEFPTVPLCIPSNLPAADCKPYYYGYCWMDVPPEEGNPFYIAAQFLYDPELSHEKNLSLAKEFMKQVRRGDFFQMTADYYYGIGAHSAIMIADYDEETDTVHWMDSNMAGEKRSGIRYAKVQYDVERSISWWADAFCKWGRGATLYRLRDDIVFFGEE